MLRNTFFLLISNKYPKKRKKNQGFQNELLTGFWEDFRNCNVLKLNCIQQICEQIKLNSSIACMCHIKILLKETFS